MLAVHFLNRRVDVVGLVALVARLVNGQRLALGILCPKFLRLAVDIMLDDRIRRRKYGLGRAVVLLQLDDRGLGIVLLEIQDVAHIGTTPAVDGLIGITDNAEIAIACSQQLRELVLRAVRILILIDEDVLEAALILRANLFIILQQLHRNHEQIIEIHRVVFLQLLLVELIERRKLFLMEIPCQTCVLRRRLHLVFCIRDGIQHVVWRVLLIIKVHFLNTLFDDRLAVRRIVDNEIVLIFAIALDFAAQETRAERMERAEPNLFCQLADKVVHTLAHLRRRLVREGDGQDMPGLHTVRQQVRDTTGQHLRLA